MVAFLKIGFVMVIMIVKMEVMKEIVPMQIIKHAMAQMFCKFVQFYFKFIYFLIYSVNLVLVFQHQSGAMVK